MSGPYAYDVKAAAAYIGVSVWTLYRMCATGEIEHLNTRGNVVTAVATGTSIVRRSGRLKFSQAGLDAWIAAHRVPVRRAEVAVNRTPEPDEARPMLEIPATRRFAR